MPYDLLHAYFFDYSRDTFVRSAIHHVPPFGTCTVHFPESGLASPAVTLGWLERNAAIVRLAGLDLGPFLAEAQ